MSGVGIRDRLPRGRLRTPAGQICANAAGHGSISPLKIFMASRPAPFHTATTGSSTLLPRARYEWPGNQRKHSFKRGARRRSTLGQTHSRPLYAGVVTRTPFALRAAS